jgi:hypothetical protein
MKKGVCYCLGGVLIFLSILFYLHQKILIYVEAYRLSKTNHVYNELVDKRDYLVYNLNKELSVAKINQWADKNDFTVVGKEKIIALNLRRKPVHTSTYTLASFFSRFLGMPTGSATALAEERE